MRPHSTKDTIRDPEQRERAARYVVAYGTRLAGDPKREHCNWFALKGYRLGPFIVTPGGATGCAWFHFKDGFEKIVDRDVCDIIQCLKEQDEHGVMIMKTLLRLRLDRECSQNFQALVSFERGLNGGWFLGRTDGIEATEIRY